MCVYVYIYIYYILLYIIYIICIYIYIYIYIYIELIAGKILELLLLRVLRFRHHQSGSNILNMLLHLHSHNNLNN